MGNPWQPLSTPGALIYSHSEANAQPITRSRDAAEMMVDWHRGMFHVPLWLLLGSLGCVRPCQSLRSSMLLNSLFNQLGNFCVR
jgi:hypothetical protein